MEGFKRIGGFEERKKKKKIKADFYLVNCQHSKLAINHLQPWQRQGGLCRCWARAAWVRFEVDVSRGNETPSAGALHCEIFPRDFLQDSGENFAIRGGRRGGRVLAVLVPYKHFVAVCTWSPASTCSLPGERSSHHDLPSFVSQRCGHSASVLPAEMEGMEAAFIKAAPTSKEQPRRGLECGTHQ